MRWFIVYFGFVIAISTTLIGTARALDPKVAAGIEDISGRVDTHFRLPELHTTAYALAFEFADELSSLCPNLFSRNYKEARAHSFSSYIYYHLGHIPMAPAKAGETWADGTVRFLAMPAIAGLPISFERRRISQLGVRTIAANLVREAGDCKNKVLEAFSANLQSIGTFGQLKYSSIKKTLIRKEDNRVGFVCYYDSDLTDTQEESQGYVNLTIFNSYRFGTPLNLIEDRINEILYGKAVGTKPRALFMRSDCPITPDPAISISSTWVSPKEGKTPPDATAGQRMAAYYINFIVPNEIKMARAENRRFPDFPPGYLEELRKEIEKFEDLPLRRDLLQPRFQMYRSKYGGRLMELYEAGTTYGIGMYPGWRVTIIEALNLQ